MTFAPDHSGISVYSTDFAEYAAEQGHQVTVVTGFSWYPTWKKRPEDRGKLFRTDFYKGIKVLRGYLYVPEKVTTLTRVFQEITFVLFVFLNFCRAGRHDVIVLFTTPINLGLVGVFFKKWWGAKLVINVQDLQLEAAKSLGMLGKLPIVEVMNRIEKYSYQKADLVASISTAMTELIRQKGITNDKIELWPNWIDVSEAKSKGKTGVFRQLFPQYQHKTIIGYAGTLGVKQGLSILIDLSEQFAKRDDVVFLIIGQGGDVVNLKAYAQEKGIKNLHFIDLLSQENYYHFLADADIVFISQRKESGDAYFPSKLLGIMAKQKLIFVSADPDSEIYRVIADNELGVTTDYGNLTQMQQLLSQYLHDKKTYQPYAQNASHFVQQYDRNAVLGHVFEQIKAL